VVIQPDCCRRRSYAIQDDVRYMALLLCCVARLCEVLRGLPSMATTCAKCTRGKLARDRWHGIPSPAVNFWWRISCDIHVHAEK
jgi:hypothetical protein